MSKPPETQAFEKQQPQTPVGPPRRPNQPGFMTYEEFLDWADEDTLAEWVDGVVVMTSPASLRHQRIANFLIATLSTFAQIHSRLARWWMAHVR
jgi:Uma2 family endonuclease